MTSILDPDLMRTLLRVHESGSFTKAGETLGLTQQAISAQIKRIEMAINKPVVDRRVSPIRLTQDGEALLYYARKSLEIAETAQRHFSSTKIHGRVRIGVLEGFASVGLPMFLASLREIQSSLEIVVETSFTDKLLIRQEAGQLDLVLGAQRKDRKRGETLRDDQLRWFGDLEKLRKGEDPVRLAIPPEPSLVRSIAIEALTRAGRTYSVMFESESRASLRAAALSGIGVTVFCSFDEDSSSDPQDDLPLLEKIEYFMSVTDPKSNVVGEVAQLLREAAETMLRANAEMPLLFS